MRWVAFVVVCVLTVGCTGPPAADLERESALVELPAPATSGGKSLLEALASRRSVREFTSEPLTNEEVSQLLWAAQGITSIGGKRTTPSAGALYPLEIYVADASGVHRYLPDGHLLEQVADTDLRAALEKAALGQEAIGGAAAVFVITGVPERTEGKYGVRAERYVQLEAGHAAQNVLLQAVALELGAVPVGAFDDPEVQRLLGLDSGEGPLYLIAVGHPVDAP